MPCKIVDGSLSVEAIGWRPAAQTAAKSAVAVGPSRNGTAIESKGTVAVATPEINKAAMDAELARCRQQALKEGVEQGRAQAAGEVKQANDRLGQIVRDLAALKRRMREEAETDVVKLSLAVARRVLHRELSTDAASLEGVVHAALGKIQNREISRVRTAPPAVEAIKAALERAGIASLEVRADVKMQLGDLVFETSLGELDASIDSQLQEIGRGFTDRLGRS